MKRILVFVSLLGLAGLAVPASDECCESPGATSSAVEQRLREIDLSILVKQYEQIQTEKARAELQLILAEPEIAESDEGSRQMAQLQRRIERLRQHAEVLRSRMVELGKPVSVAAK